MTKDDRKLINRIEKLDHKNLLMLVEYIILRLDAIQLMDLVEEMNQVEIWKQADLNSESIPYED